MTLYELTDLFKQIQALAQDDDEQAFNDTLDSVNWKEDFEEKAEGYVQVIRNIELDIASDDGQIEYLEKLLETAKKGKTSKENKIKRMKNDLLKAMNDTGHTKFRTKLFSFWTQKTTPSVVIEEGATIPMDFLTIPEPKPDKKKIADALKGGKELPFAHMEQGETVRFK